MGFVFAMGGIAHMIGSNTVPLLLARFSARAITAMAAGLMALNLASVGLYSDKVWAVFLFVGVFGFCWAICFVSSSIYLLELVPEARSTVSAMQSAAMELGIGAGAAIGGLLLSILDDYERMFRSLALVIPLAFLLLATGSIRSDENRSEEHSTAVETQAA